jgi:hypothetical protein
MKNKSYILDSDLKGKFSYVLKYKTEKSLEPNKKHTNHRKATIFLHLRDNIDFTEKEYEKFIKITGKKYNKHSDTLKVTFDQFDTFEKNESYLVQLIKEMIKEAKVVNENLVDDVEEIVPQFEDEETLLNERLSNIDIEEEQSARYYEEWKKAKYLGIPNVNAGHTWYKSNVEEKEKKTSTYDLLGYGQMVANEDGVDDVKTPLSAQEQILLDFKNRDKKNKN